MRKPIRPVVIDGDVVRVPLTQGLEAVVDLADLALVEGRNWCAARRRRTWYAVTGVPTTSDWTKILMHRVIMGCQPGDPRIDHRDGDGLNNRRANLREATETQNLANSRPRDGGTSGFKGVYWSKQRQYWVAQVGVNGQKRHLGIFHSEEAAARAYDAAAIETFGEFAQLNFPQIEDPTLP